MAAVGAQKSPVEGYGKFTALTSEQYKKKKKAEVGTTKPNLELSGEMLDEVQFEDTKEGIKIGVFGDAALRADGHNNLSGRSKLPTRRFIPDKGEVYNSRINREVERIISDAISETIGPKAKLFEDVESKSELYSALRTYFGERSVTNAELKLSVFRNPDLLAFLEEMELDGYL